jgi:hypothetical protein
VTYTSSVAFEALAYGPEANVLLVVDGNELIAYDAHTEAPKWQVVFEAPLLSVMFAHPQALPSVRAGGSPWREAAATHAAIALDDQGSFHAVDLALGNKLGSVGPFGKPRAAASCVASGALAMAVDDKVLVWRSGQRIETRLSQVTALAFSADGGTLAVGTAGGDVVMLSLEGPARTASPAELQPAAPADALVRTFETHGVGAVTDLVAHPSGAWLSAGASGVFAVTASGAQRLEKISAGALRARFDGPGARLAVQRAERAIVVYAWPGLSVVARIEYTGRPIRGLSFGAEDWLGVGLDQGDGNKIDIVTSATHRTDTAPGRTHRSWTLHVEGQRSLLTAKEADEIRRMKSPFHEETPRAKGNGAGGKVGIGAGLSIAMLLLRLCAHSSGSSYSSSYNTTPYTPPVSHTCDAECAKSRVAELERDCLANAALGCADDVRTAKLALAGGRCRDALTALKRISSGGAAGGTQSSTPLFGAHRLLAEFGLDEACRSGAIRPPPAVKHVQLVRVVNSGMIPITESLPEENPARGETPRALFAAPDGTVFAATSTDLTHACVVYKRSGAHGTWAPSFTTMAPPGAVQLFGRGSSDVYLATGSGLAHFDGTAWSKLPTPGTGNVDGAAGVGGDVFLALGTADDGSTVHRRRSGAWSKEALPAGVTSVLAMYGGGGALWAVGEDPYAKESLLRRAPAGGWSTRSPDLQGNPLVVRSFWVSPSGEAFLGSTGSVLRSNDAGSTWSEEPRPDAVVALWGRSGTDVYALEGSALVHFDGKRWSSIDAQLPGAQSLAGTASEVLVLSASASATPSDD